MCAWRHDEFFWLHLSTESTSARRTWHCTWQTCVVIAHVHGFKWFALQVRRRSTGDTLKSDIRIYRRSMADSGVDSPTGQLSRGTATTRTLPRNFGGESMLTRSKPDDSGGRRRDSSRSSTGGWRLTPDDAVSFEFKSVVRPSSRTSSNSGVTASTG